ncbi:MAG: cytochrome C [Woeseiaceae bacterium]|nr:cytochrome C [Woeseiaceae bacterium]
MQDMSNNMQVITAAISREDWDAVATAAPLIADHPQPPLLEKTRILRFVGANTGEFRSHDNKTKQAAQALQQAAARSDGHAVIASFATLQNSCLAYHQSFRKPFVEHFYGQR